MYEESLRPCERKDEKTGKIIKEILNKENFTLDEIIKYIESIKNNKDKKGMD